MPGYQSRKINSLCSQNAQYAWDEEKNTPPGREGNWLTCGGPQRTGPFAGDDLTAESLLSILAGVVSPFLS